MKFISHHIQEAKDLWDTQAIGQTMTLPPEPLPLPKGRLSRMLLKSGALWHFSPKHKNT